MTPQARQTYRPDIDGLRAVAVLSVIGFHAFSSWVPGGFVGVDIFFVISGTLITTILLGDLRDDAFSYRTFYARRIKRILPALVVVLGSVWLAGWFRLYPDEYRQLGKHIAAGSGFVSNLVLRGEAGYFDNVAESKPLLHLWSLAIEEQFYIVWPLVLAVVTRCFTSTRAALWTMAVLASLSFALNVATLDTVPVFAFFSPLTRFWELMIGGLLAVGLQGGSAWFTRFRETRSVCGFALLVASIFLVSRAVPYPGWHALLPTAGAFLVISAGPEARLNRSLLAHPVAVWLGRISYPLYLWHWPLLSFAFIGQTLPTPAGVRIALVALSILLAWLTWRLVETPVRGSADVKAVPIGLLVALVVVGSVGYATYREYGFGGRLRERGDYVAQFDENTPEMRYRTRHDINSKFREECNFYDFIAWRDGHSTETPRESIDPSCYRRPVGTTRAVFLWGDSHVEHLNWGLREILSNEVALLQVGTSGCGADLVSPDDPATHFCTRSNRFALETIRREKPDVVVLAQRQGHAMPRFRRIAEALRRFGIRHVVVLGPVPQWKPNLAKTIASHYWPTPPDRLDRDLDPYIVALNHRLANNRKPDDPFVYVDLFDALCDPRGCRTYVDGDWNDALMTFDYGHFTPRASLFVARTIVGPVLLPLLAAPSGTPAE